MLGVEALEQPSGEVWFGRMGRIGRRLGRSLLCGDALLLQGLFRLIPCAERGGGLRESKAHGAGNFGRHEHKKDATLSPDLAPTCLIAQWIQMGKRLGRFRTRVVRVIKDKAASCDAIMTQDHAHTGPQELVPGHLAVTKHPRQGCP